MYIFNPIKLFIGHHFLKRELKHVNRNLKLYNYNQAQSFGIVYEYKNEEEFKLVEQLIHQLNDEKKKVKVMVYIKNEKLLEYIPQRLTVDYVRPHEIDWLGRPNSPYARDFMNTPFHVLLDLNYNQSFPLKYIASLSKAYYKVGVFHDSNKQQLDLMIKVNPEMGLNYVLREIIRYLKLIKSR